MSGLAQAVQVARRDSAALLSRPEPVPVAARAARLAAHFPVIRRLVGDESFDAIACRHIIGEPAGSSGLLPYAESFPRFVRSLGTAASIEYLADIAELELACVRASHAPDVAPIEVDAFSLPPACHDRLRLAFHPSVSLLASRFPIVSIWEANQTDEEQGHIERWSAEAALVARPARDVEVCRLPRGGHAFLSALKGGATMAEAVETARAATQQFDIAANLAILARASIIVGRHGGMLPRAPKRRRMMAGHRA